MEATKGGGNKWKKVVEEQLEIVLTKAIVDISLIAFYCVMTYSGNLLANRAIQKVSTMPSFTMGQVYRIFPVAGALCVFAAIIHLLVTITEKNEKEVSE